jgi:hypothetical protein
MEHSENRDNLTPAEFLQSVLRTANNTLETAEIVSNCCVSLVEEFGEFCGLLKKQEFHKHPFDNEKCILELGDSLFYLFWLCSKLVPSKIETIFAHTFTVQFSKNHYTIPGASNKNYAQMISYSTKDLFNVVSSATATSIKPDAIPFVIQRMQSELEISSLRYLASLSVLARTIGVDSNWGEIAFKNREKLMRRYPDGFSSQASLSRPNS